MPYCHTYGRTILLRVQNREEKGRAIAQNVGSVKRIDDCSYKVLSQTGRGWYDLYLTQGLWYCSCPDQVFRDAKCKHVYAVEFSLALRKRVSSQVIIAPVSIQACLRCGSERLVKHGIRHNDTGSLQRFTCHDCQYRFTVNLGFEKMKATPQAITGAMQLYFTGESLRNVQKFLALQGVKVSHVAVYKWIAKYVVLMRNYLEQVKPQVSETWRADELYLKVKGNMKYLFAMMDDQTRFWIAQEVAGGKETYDARRLFKKARELIGNRPETLITDGLHSYAEAYRKEFYTLRNPRTEHIRHITIKGDRNNNKMERLNGEIRDREKVMRGLKTPETPILPGYQIYHNYVRPHEALVGKTPAEACGIKVEGENKWITLIQNASKRVPSLIGNP